MIGPIAFKASQEGQIEDIYPCPICNTKSSPYINKDRSPEGGLQDMLLHSNYRSSILNM